MRDSYPFLLPRKEQVSVPSKEDGGKSIFTQTDKDLLLSLFKVRASLIAIYFIERTDLSSDLFAGCLDACQPRVGRVSGIEICNRIRG
jgi:hypothetical protein